MRKPKTKLFILATLLAIVALLLWRRSAHTSAMPDPLSSAAPPKSAAAPHVKAAGAAATAGQTNPSMSRNSLIGSITLDKRRACPGEPVQASIKKKPEISGPVQFSIPGRADGDQVILSYDDPGKQLVDVVASDGRGGVDYGSTEIEILAPDSPECAAKPVLTVWATVSGHEADTANIRVMEVRNFGPMVRYTYDFGDGTVQSSAQGRITHNYQLRAQNQPMSSFVIKVEAADKHGNKAVGRASVAFTNLHWVAKLSGSPIVPVAYDRFAEKRGSSYETDLTFRNIENQAIRLETAQVTIETCTGRNPAPRNYPADQVVRGLAVLEGEEAQSATLSLPVSDLEGACRVVVVLEGDTIPGRAGDPVAENPSRLYDPTRARIALDIEAPPLVGALPQAAPIEVTNELLAAKLEKAEAILGKNRPITPEDLQRLEGEGRL